MLPSTCSIDHRPDLGAFVVRRPIDALFPRPQADFEAVLAVTRQHATGRWLLNARRREHLALQLGDWIGRV